MRGSAMHSLSRAWSASPPPSRRDPGSRSPRRLPAIPRQLKAVSGPPGPRRSGRVACATGDCGRRPNSARTAVSAPVTPRVQRPHRGAEPVRSKRWQARADRRACSEVTPARGVVWAKAPRRNDATLSGPQRWEDMDDARRTAAMRGSRGPAVEAGGRREASLGGSCGMPMVGGVRTGPAAKSWASVRGAPHTGGEPAGRR